MDPMDIVGKSKEDVSLPKSTMTKIIKEMLPPDVRVARDTQDLLVECCVEFINLLSSESNDVCSRDDKKTIAPEHVIRALQDLGFKEYVEEVYAAYEHHKLDTLESPKASKFTRIEMTEEEAVAEQQRILNRSNLCNLNCSSICGRHHCCCNLCPSNPCNLNCSSISNHISRRKCRRCPNLNPSYLNCSNPSPSPSPSRQHSCKRNMAWTGQLAIWDM
ncbi:hypothetical protein ZWY2020_027271 [Hordeum vulgare]|nr:hypothetical protein ZWY2020_027271 [Hordeum vulgare]